jgi:hypothetical protein
MRLVKTPNAAANAFFEILIEVLRYVFSPPALKGELGKRVHYGVAEPENVSPLEGRGVKMLSLNTSNSLLDIEISAAFSKQTL